MTRPWMNALARSHALYRVRMVVGSGAAGHTVGRTPIGDPHRFGAGVWDDFAGVLVAEEFVEADAVLNVAGEDILDLHIKGTPIGGMAAIGRKGELSWEALDGIRHGLG